MPSVRVSLGAPVLVVCAGADRGPLRGLVPGPRRCSGLHRPQTEAEVLEQSAQTLRAHLGALLSALSRSVRACPAVVRATFRQLFRRVRERFPGAQHEVRPLAAGLGGGESGGRRGRGGEDRAHLRRRAGRGRGHGDRRGQRQWGGGCSSPGLGESSPRCPHLQNLPFIAVTSFLCLRFFSPAIMAPKLFHLRERHADARTSRTLLLLAKVRACGPGRDAQLGAEHQGSFPGLQCVPTWLRGPVVGTLMLSRGTALYSLQSFLMVAQCHG